MKKERRERTGVGGRDEIGREVGVFLFLRLLVLVFRGY